MAKIAEKAGHGAEVDKEVEVGREMAMKVPGADLWTDGFCPHIGVHVHNSNVTEDHSHQEKSDDGKTGLLYHRLDEIRICDVAIVVLHFAAALSEISE